MKVSAKAPAAPSGGVASSLSSSEAKEENTTFHSTTSPGGDHEQHEQQPLSELGKQLRRYQAKTVTLGIEMARLGRQLQILADLKGVSVASMRTALETACQNQALAEWSSRVALLQAQLNQFQQEKEKETEGNSSISNTPQWEQEAADHHVATLELQVGELQELQQSQRSELDTVYEKLKLESAQRLQWQSKYKESHTKLQSAQGALGLEQMLTKQQQKTIDEQQEALDRLQLAQSKQVGSSSPSSQLDDSSHNKSTQEKKILRTQLQQEYEKRYKQKRRRDDRAKAKLQENYEKQLQEHQDRATQRSKDLLELQLKFDALQLDQEQWTKQNQQLQLRNEQLEARLQVQDERRDDLEQQLSSLYAAFILLKQEAQQQRRQRAQQRQNEKIPTQPPSPFEVASSPEYVLANHNHNVLLHTTDSDDEFQPKSPLPPSSSSSSGRRQSYHTTSSSSLSSDLNFSPKKQGGRRRTSTGSSLNTWDILLGVSNNNNNSVTSSYSYSEEDCLLQGPLLLQLRNRNPSTNILTWHPYPHAALYRGTTHFVLQLDSDSDSLYLEPGVSVVERTRRSDDTTTFVIRHVNNNKSRRRGDDVVVLATRSSHDTTLWIDTLNRALLGSSYQPATTKATSFTGKRRSSSSTCHHPKEEEEQEALSLARALSLSVQDT